MCLVLYYWELGVGTGKSVLHGISEWCWLVRSTVVFVGHLLWVHRRSRRCACCTTGYTGTRVERVLHGISE